MSETASLVIAVDSTDADRAVKSLRDLAQQGKVTESSLKQTGDSSRNLKRVSNEAESAARSMGLLESAAKGVVAALSIREIVGAVDGYTQLTAQIKLVTNSTQEYARAYQSVRDIARTTQADLSSTAMLYARIANATKELGVSQQTVADITEAVNLSLRVSGASAAEASSAMLQLSQAFAGGVLRGEEFNAVIESSPRLIQALAEGMGVTVGQMRSLAADGKITAEVMANVLPQALGKLRDEAQHVQTISGAFQNLRNEVLELIGTQAQATGFTNAVSGGLNLLANNLNLVVAAATTLGAARVMGALVTGITALGSASAVAGAALSMLGGPVGILTGTLVAGAFAWNAYRDSIDATRNALTNIDAPIDQVVEKFRKLSELEQQIALRGLADAVKEAEADLSEAFDNLAKVPLRLRNSPAFAQFKDDLAALKKQSDDGSISFEELSARVSELVESFKEANPGVRAAHDAIERAGVAVIEVARHVGVLNERNKALKGSTEGVADSLDRAAIAAARAAAGLNTKEWDTFIQKAEAAATTVGMTAQQLGEFQARAMGASEAQAQLAGVLHGMADTARQLEKATADKDFKAIKGAQDTLAALAQQEVQLRVNIRQAEAYAALLAMGLSQASALQGSQTEAELEGLRAMEEVLQRIQNLRDNIENSTKPSKSATSAAEKATKAINDQIKALQLQAATVGMAEDQVTLYKLATEGATKAQLASAKAALDARRAGELSLAVAKRRIDTSNDAIKAAAEEAQRNIDLAETFGLSAAGIEQLTVARLEHELARAEAAGADADEIERLKILIALRQESMGALITLEQKERQKQQWESWARDVEQIFNRVGQSLTDAIFDGGKSAKDLLRDLFKGLTFNILINPVMNQLQGWVTNQLGGMFGVQNPAQGGGILGTAQNLYSGYNAITGGLNSTLGNAAQWLGQKIGSEALTSFGLGLSGTTAATGIASIGASLGASLGTSIGTSAAAMTTTTFSAALGGGAAAGGAAAGGAAAGSAAAGGAAAGGAAGIGSAVGAALPWIGGALAIGSAFGLFDDGPPKTRHAQMSHADLQADGRFAVTTWDDRQSRESQNAAAAYATEAVRNATELFGKIGIDAEFKRFTTLMESSILGDKQGVGSSGTIRIGDLEHEIGLAIESSWTKHGVGGWSEAEMLPRLMTDVQLTILEAFQAAGDQLPSVLSGMLEGVDIRSLGAEEAQALAQTFGFVVEQVTGLQEAVERLPFAQLRDLSFDAAANLIQFAGGLENLNAGMTSYFQNFYSEAEQLDWLSSQISTSLSELGLTMPDVAMGADAAKAAYRELVESLDLTTEEGQRAYATLMTLSGGFHELVTGMDQLADAAARAAEEQRRAAEEQRREAEQLRQQLMGDLSTAYNAVVQAGQREIARLQESFGATDNALNAYRSAVQRLESEFNSLFSAIDRGIQALRGTGAAFDAQYHQARAVISTTLLTGQLPQTADLSEAIRVAQQGVMGQRFASREDQQRAYLTLANEMEAIKEIAGPELDAAQATLAQLEDQYRLLRGMSLVGEDSLKALENQLRTAISTEEVVRHQVSVIEQQLEEARRQYDALTGIDTSIKDLATAVREFAAAAAAARTVVGGGGGGNSGPDYINGVHVGVGSDFQRAADYYRANPDVAAAFNSGASGDMSFDAFAKYHYETYGRYEGRKSFAVGTSYVPYDMRANIHKGEIIIDPRSSDILRRYGIGVQGGGSSRETEQLLREQLSEVRQQNRYLYEIVKSGKRNERNTEDVANAIAHGDSDGIVVVM